MLDSAPRLAWMASGDCRGLDPELFHPERGDNAGVRAAKAVCAGCPVLDECRDWSLEHAGRLGIFAEMTDKERARERKRRLNARTLEMSA